MTEIEELQRKLASAEAGRTALLIAGERQQAEIVRLAKERDHARATVVREIAREAREIADEFDRPFRELAGDAATLRWFASRIEASTEAGLVETSTAPTTNTPEGS